MNNEIQIVLEDTAKAVKLLKITTDEQLIEASDILKIIKTNQKAIKDQKELITRPMLDALSETRELFREAENKLIDAEDRVKEAITKYHDSKEAERQKLLASLEKKVESGRMKPETAAGKLSNFQEAPKVTGMSVRVVKKVRVIDLAKIPREFLVPDMALIADTVIRANTPIDGVEMYDEKIISSRTA